MQTEFLLDPALASILKLREGMVLYGVALAHRSGAAEGADPEDRLMTLIMTPYPEASWPQLLRLSVTIDHRPGSLHSLITALSSLQLYPRSIEDITGTSLDGVTLFAPGRNKELPHGQESTPLILPSAMLVLELPAPDAVHPDLLLLHKQLRSIITSGAPGDGTAREVEQALSQRTDRPVSIRWISPMATLNKLSELLPDVPRLDRIRISKASTDERTSFGGQHAVEDRLAISLHPWRHWLWRNAVAKLPSDDAAKQPQTLVMSAADSDEKIVSCYFYEFTDRLVVQFEIVVPAHGLEHVWWEYVYDCVRTANATMLSSESSARFDARWGILKCAVMFHLRIGDRAEQDIRAIVGCFRKLQGNSSHTPAFKDFRCRLKKESARLKEELAGATTWAEPSTLSRLERVNVWSPLAVQPPQHLQEIFAKNPFGFTNPLGFDSYRKLYGQDERTAGGRRTRLNLAETIIDKITGDPSHNIAIVGAHRAGKTTLLNLVYDQLLEGLISESTAAPIPIRINAAVTPPHLLFIAILEQIAKLEKKGKPVAALRQSLEKHSESYFLIARKILSAVEWKTEYGTIRIGDASVDAIQHHLENQSLPISEHLRGLLVRVGKDDEAALPEFLALSLEAVRAVLAELEKQQQHPVRLLVLMDEFSESTAWGHLRALGIWRHAIESDEFDRLRWLFSTTRPIRETVSYSPLTNLFLEVNVGSLRPEECECMIDAFSVTGWKQEVDDGLLRPVVTHPARKFLVEVTSGLPYLLQVSCYHIYDRATRFEFPIINKMLCRKIIFSRVLPEMADYLEHQWSQIPERAKQFVEASLPRGKYTRDEFLQSLAEWKVDLEQMPPGSLKALDRSGLRGDDGRCVAPLVAAWLLSAGEGPRRDHETLPQVPA
jgi:hypothetical protein